MNEALLSACESEDPKALAAAIAETDFWLVNVSANDQRDTSALVFEIDGFSALVAFSSEDHAGTFAELAKDVPLNEHDELPCFIVNGKEFLENTTKKTGVVLNPETEHCYLLPPILMRKIKKIAFHKG